MIVFKQKGDYSKATKYLKKLRDFQIRNILEKYGRAGVDALSSATPTDTGKTAGSWYYEIEKTKAGYSIVFGNSNVNKGVPIAIILQYGHGTRNGGWVEGRDYINPAIQPIFDEITKNIFEEVDKL